MSLRKSPLTRMFEAGKVERDAFTWGQGSVSINQDIYQYLRPMRQRSRYLWANNEYFKRFIDFSRRQIVGPKGHVLQWKAKNLRGNLMKPFNVDVEAKFSQWARRGMCDVTARMTWVDCQKLYQDTLFRDGECLIVFEENFDNAQGFALRFIEVDRIDIELNLHRAPGTGNQIIMGVEVNADGRHVAYHLKDPSAQIHEFANIAARRHVRVPAERCLFDFIQVRPEQVRGFPIAHAAIVALHDTGAYRQAAIIAARVGAAKLAFWKTDSKDGGAFDELDESGQRVLSPEPGTFNQIGLDDDIVEWNPNYPHEQFGEFNKAMLRGIFSTLGMSYHSGSGDLEGVTFSSARIGGLDERDYAIEFQERMQCHMVEPVVWRWFRYCLFLGRFRNGRTLARPSEFDRLYAPRLQGRRWEHVQPREQQMANALGLGMRTKSVSGIIRAQGEDPEELLQEISDDAKLFEKLGIPETLISTIKLVEIMTEPDENVEAAEGADKQDPAGNPVPDASGGRSIVRAIS